MTAIKLVLLDIEGTTLPISFVKDVLFPYSSRELPGMLTRLGDDPRVRVALGDIEREYPGQTPLSVIEGWIARDEKAAPLKTLQGLAWAGGFQSGELKSSLYPDVLPALRAWHEAGLRLAVYSSGSAEAQRLLYGYTSEGDVTGLFEGFYDLDIGPKKVAESYTEIARRAGLRPEEILFLSDVGAELAAAREAGCQVCQLVRSEDGTVAAPGFPAAPTLPDAARESGLPIA